MYRFTERKLEQKILVAEGMYRVEGVRGYRENVRVVYREVIHRHTLHRISQVVYYQALDTVVSAAITVLPSSAFTGFHSRFYLRFYGQADRTVLEGVMCSVWRLLIKTESCDLLVVEEDSNTHTPPTPHQHHHLVSLTTPGSLA